MTSPNYQSLDLSAEELTQRNLQLKRDREKGVEDQAFKSKLLLLIKENQEIRAVTLCFSDLEGKLHMLDYNKEFFVKSMDNLTFDGSSIKGFTAQHQSDLRIYPDWTSFRWLPASVFGAGKVMMFGKICRQDGTAFENDMRSKLSDLLETMRKDFQQVLVAPEIEGFLLRGTNAEQRFSEVNPFELATETGYYSGLPQDDLQKFTGALAEELGSLGFEIEKYHSEVAPGQFEVNWMCTDALGAADQILIHKLVARQVANTMGKTASFLPKPFTGINGSGMHINMSISRQEKNTFYDGADEDRLSKTGRNFAAGILKMANDLCLLMNSSVNAYRRLDPHYEAPNAIQMSDRDRGSMVRIPVGNERSARIEVRTVAPDANPYLTFYALIRAGLLGIDEQLKVPEGKVKKLPSTLYEGIEHFERSEFMKEIMGEDAFTKYAALKRRVADRSAREHGKTVKTEEVRSHHEVTNQYLWDQF